MTLESGLNAFLIAFLVSAIFALPCLRLLRRQNIRQRIDPYAPEDHRQKEGTPTMGGMIFLAGLVGWALLDPDRGAFVGWLLGFAALGFVDDFVVPRMTGKRGLGWLPKLAAQMVLAALLPGMLGLDWNLVSTAFGVFVVLFFVNAFNFADGLDALGGSIAVVYALGLAAMAVLFNWGFGGVYGAGMALAGGIVAFLFVNVPRAKVFMGDLGSLPVGAWLGTATLLPFVSEGGLSPNPMVGPLAVISLVMIAELVPVPIQVGYFKLTGRRIFPSTPIHHGFQKCGFAEVTIVWYFVLTQLVVTVVALAWALRGGWPG